MSLEEIINDDPLMKLVSSLPGQGRSPVYHYRSPQLQILFDWSEAQYKNWEVAWGHWESVRVVELDDDDAKKILTLIDSNTIDTALTSQ